MTEAATVPDWAQARAEHKPVTRTTHIPMRSDLFDEIERLEHQAQVEAQTDALENRAPVAPELARRIQQAEAEIEASAVAFTFTAIGRRALRLLEAGHPPTDQQIAEAETEGAGRPRWNVDTFPPALLAASCTAPAGFDLAAAIEVWDTWSEGQTSQLWSECLTANMGTRDVGPKSLIASAILRE